MGRLDSQLYSPTEAGEPEWSAASASASRVGFQAAAGRAVRRRRRHRRARALPRGGSHTHSRVSLD
jgi:hypothetical protein